MSKALSAILFGCLLCLAFLSGVKARELIAANEILPPTHPSICKEEVFQVNLAQSAMENTLRRYTNCVLALQPVK